MKSLGKTKIYELAKKIGVENSVLLEIAKKNNIAAKSHLSAITEEEAGILEEAIKGEKNLAPAQKKEVKKETKKDEPAIIRRTVIISDEEVERRTEEEKKRKSKRK